MTGSSVPEAARAAVPDEAIDAGVAAVSWDYPHLLACYSHAELVHAILRAAAPFIVAAAVAEERATTGRRDAERERYIKTLVKERDAAERKVHAVETVTCWTNEDGKRFMFVDDVAVALEIPGSRAALESPGEGG